MKKSMKITIMAAIICMIMGAWAVAFAKAESVKTSSVDTAASASTATLSSTVSAGTATTLGTGTSTAAASAATAGTPLFAKNDLFSDRDLQQEVDLTDAVTYTLTDGQSVSITAAGVYVLTGSAKNATVYVEADKEDKVQLVLDGLSVTNRDTPVIYVKSADKVFVTTAADSTLTVTGSFTADGDTNTDGVIFSKSDLVLNGTGTLTVSSTRNGIVGKDDLKITGGTYVITAQVKAIEANDSIRVSDGVLQLTAGTDGLHAENDDDNSKGYIYIGGGTIAITAGDDGIHATTAVQVDGGAITITGSEGIEVTYVQLNGGTIAIDSWVEINGGDITVSMAAGDTDGVDSNGDIIVNGGTIQVTGNSTFDYDGSAQYNGGTIIVNGQQIDYIPNQMMGGRGGFGGGFGGGRGGFGGRGRG